MLEALTSMGERLGCGSGSSVWALSEAELLASLDTLHALEQRLVEVKLALVREIDGRGVAAERGCSSTAVLLRERLRAPIQAGRRLVNAALLLDRAPEPVRAALSAGVISVEQALVIAETVAALPTDAVDGLFDPAVSTGATNQKSATETTAAAAGEPGDTTTQAADATTDAPGTDTGDIAERATDMLLDWAGQFDPGALRRLGGRVLAHVAPHLAEAAEERALRRAEQRHHDRRHLTWSTKPDGSTRLTGRLDPETAALLHTALDPLCAPHGLGDDRSPGQRRHDALADICRLALATGQLPENGGDRPQLVITTRYDTLTGQLTAGTLDTGLQITPEAVRRLACDAKLVPAVLGGASQVLDVGRQRRLIDGPLRRALVLRDRGCAFPGCDRPARWCDGHHITPWTQGGQTALDNSVLLCRYHHRTVHHTDWQVRLAADGHPEFLPPLWLDPDQQPRRNPHHHLRI